MFAMILNKNRGFSKKICITISARRIGYQVYFLTSLSKQNMKQPGNQSVNAIRVLTSYKQVTHPDGP
jgi:hypothetical protein